MAKLKSKILEFVFLIKDVTFFLEVILPVKIEVWRNRSFDKIYRLVTNSGYT